MKTLVTSLVLACAAVITNAQSVELAWTAVNSPNVAGYKIYYGTASGVYTGISSVGNVTQATIVGLHPGTTYFFAATTLSTNGQESGYSSEVEWVDGSFRSTLQFANGQVTIVPPFDPGHAYRVEASTDLHSWIPVGYTSTTNPYHEATNLSHRFYRLRY